MSSGSFDPEKYTLVLKTQFDALLDGTSRMSELIKPLIEQRDMLQEQCEKLTQAGDQLVTDAQKLMEKFKVLKADRDRLQKENERLGAALAQRMPKKKKGEGAN